MSEPLSDSALDQLFRTARTYNGYLDKPVSETQLHAIWDLAKFGPTSANSLPARIVWCVTDEAKQKLAAFALPANAEKILAAPVTAIVAMDNEFYEHLPELFPHADARSWFVGNAALAETTAFRNRACRAPISSSRRARSVSIPGRCRGSTTRRSTKPSSPTSPA
jgi:3-hydroxypropanoate dehydrogenase